MGVIDYLSFGCECDDIELLKKTAHIVTKKETNEKIAKLLKTTEQNILNAIEDMGIKQTVHSALWLEKGYIPVVSTIGCDDEGCAYNINGDTAAAFIAGALGAERLIMMTDINGVLRDKDDPSTLIREMSIEEAKGLYDEGIISGGMIPKVDCCIEAINEGVSNVVIMDGRVPHAILMELLTDEGAGTMVTR